MARCFHVLSCFLFFGAFLQEAEEDMKSCFAFTEKDSGNGGGKTDKPESGKRVTSGSRKRVGEKVADTGSRKAPRMDEEKKGPTPRKLFEEDEEEEDPRASSDKDDDDDDAEDVPTPPGLAPSESEDNDSDQDLFHGRFAQASKKEGGPAEKKGKEDKDKKGDKGPEKSLTAAGEPDAEPAEEDWLEEEPYKSMPDSVKLLLRKVDTKVLKALPTTSNSFPG